MKKSFLFIFIVICAVVLVTPMAMADLIGPYPGTDEKASDAIFDILGPDAILIDKQEFDDGVPGDIEGELPGIMDITIYGDDYEFATISWDLTGTGYEAWIVVVKDGDKIMISDTVDTQWVYYTVTDDQRIIGGDDVVFGLSFDEPEGAISHISLYGKATAVPEPGTLLLLGIGLVGIGILGRKLKK